MHLGLYSVHILATYYISDFMIAIPEEKNNSERPVDALTEKRDSLTHNLKSRDASASENRYFQ